MGQAGETLDDADSASSAYVTVEDTGTAFKQGDVWVLKRVARTDRGA
jgi:hypothetical protein